MAKLIMSVGIPGSGKTTVLKAFAHKWGYTYICPDDIRIDLTGDASDQSKNREVWEEAHRRLGVRLSAGETVVFDATFTQPELRKKFLAFAREHGADKIEGLLFDVDFEVAKERNEARERKVPDDVLERMRGMLQSVPPDVAEGFDALFTFDENHEITRVELQRENTVIRKEFERMR